MQISRRIRRIPEGVTGKMGGMPFIQIFLLLWGLAAGIPLHAGLIQFGACSGLVFLGEEVADPGQLVRDTHRELLDKLGGKLTPETLAKMADGGDPFAVPEQPGIDLSALSSRLKEFEAMVRDKKWDSAELRTHLLADLRERSSAGRRTTEKVQREVGKSWSAYVIERPHVNRFQVSPDGRYLVTHVSGIGPSTAHLFDLQEQKEVPAVRTTGPFNMNQAVYTHGGEALIAGGLNGQLFRIPAGGPLTVAGMTTLGKADGSLGTPHEIAVTSDDRAAYVHLNDTAKLDPKRGIFRFDLKTGERVRVKFATPIDWRAYENWGLDPATDTLWITSESKSDTPGTGKVLGRPNQTEVLRFKVKENGETEALPGWTWTEPETTQLVWSHDGQSAMGFGKDALQLATAPFGAAGSVKDLGVPLNPVDQPVDVLDVKVHPTENKAAVLVYDGQRDHLLWYDLKTGKRLGASAIPYGHYSSLEIAGPRFLLKMAQGREFYVGNFDAMEIP